MKLSQVNVAMDHRIVDGSEFQWSCWPDARYIDYESEHAHVSVVFNTRTQEIYSAEVSHKTGDQRPYRWQDPKHKQTYINEAVDKGVDHENAWDYINWIDLDLENDWLEKATAIFNGLSYDERIEIAVEFTDKELLKYAIMAHEQDITLNQLIERALMAAISRHGITNDTDC